MTELENPAGRDMTVEVVGATFAAILAIGTGPLAPVVTAAATPLTTRMIGLVAAELRRKSNVVAESALAASRLDPEDFCDALAADPDMIALTQQVLWAASVSGSEQKLRALGDLLGRAAANPGDRLDETQVLIAALRDIEGPHLLVLEVLTGASPDQWVRGPQAGWIPSHVTARVDLDPEFVPACLSALTRHGLATLDISDGSQRFVVTQLGRAIEVWLLLVVVGDEGSLDVLAGAVVVPDGRGEGEAPVQDAGEDAGSSAMKS